MPARRRQARRAGPAPRRATPARPARGRSARGSRSSAAGRLVDAGQGGDAGQAHGADAVGQRELAGGGQDLLPPLLLLLRAAGAQKRLARLRAAVSLVVTPSLPVRNLSHQRFVINTTSGFQSMAIRRGIALEKGSQPMSQVFFLTGSSRGLGRKIAEAVLAAGHQLVATARQPGPCPTWPSATATGSCRSRSTCRPGRGGRGGGRGRRRVRPHRRVVNNAGYANPASIEDITAEDFASSSTPTCSAS